MLNFEIDDKYVTLINCQEESLEHLNNKPMSFDELIFKLRYSGILLAPTDEDIVYSGLRVKVRL